MRHQCPADTPEHRHGDLESVRETSHLFVPFDSHKQESKVSSRKAGRAGLTSPRSSVNQCKTTQGVLTLQERRSSARTLELKRPRRSDKAEVSGSNPLRPTPTVPSQLDFHGRDSPSRTTVRRCELQNVHWIATSGRNGLDDVGRVRIGAVSFELDTTDSLVGEPAE
jgi:hypothetical protein